MIKVLVEIILVIAKEADAGFEGCNLSYQKIEAPPFIVLLCMFIFSICVPAC